MKTLNFLTKLASWGEELSARIRPVGVSYPGSESFAVPTERRARDEREMSERRTATQSGARVAREWLKDKMGKCVNCAKSVMQIFKLTKLTKLTEQIFTESLKSLKCLKSLMQIFATYATSATSASANFVVKESNESTVRYRVKSRIPSYLYRYSLDSNLSRSRSACAPRTPSLFKDKSQLSFPCLASLFCLCMLTIGSGNVWGAEKTINVGDFTTCAASEISQTIDGFTFYCENGLIDSESFRAYSGKVFRVTSSVGSMSKIVFTFTGTANNRSWGVGAKTYTVNPNSTTWQITGPNQARITKIVITYTPAGKTDPTASFSNGTYTIGGSALNLSTLWTSNSDGAVTYTVTSAGGTGASISTASFTATTAGSCTVKASQAATASYNAIEKSATITVQNPTCATPTFSPAEGAYLGTQSVTISCATGGSSIYYTTNGSTPTTSSTLYSGAISVSSTTTIKAIATKSGYANSTVASATYTITPAYTVTWKNQGATITTTGAASGTKPTLPSDATMESESGCGKYTYFYGWAEDVWSGEVSSPGTSSTVKVYKTASEMPNVSADVTYHAVWGDSPGGWTLATSIAAGDVIVIANTTNSKELTGVSSNIGTATTYSSSPAGTFPLTVEAGSISGKFSFKNGTNYLSYTSGNNLYTSTEKNSNSSWTCLYSNGDWSITNVAVTDRRLRYNSGQPRFCCYTSAQTSVQIFKQSAEANCVTSCCTKLGAIDGEITLTQGGNSVTISGWTYDNANSTTEANVSSYTVKLYKKNGANWDLVSGSTSGGSAGTQGTRTGIATNSKSVTYTGLIVESEYKFTVQAIAGSASYCDGDETAVTEINSTDVSSTPFKFRYSIYIDNGSGSGWAHHYITPTANANEGSVDITLTAHVTSYQFKIFGGFSGNWGQTGEDGVIPASTKWTLNGSYNVKLNTGAGGAYTFTVDYSGTTNPGVTVTFPSATQNSGYKIYFDKSIIAGWGNTLKYRIGNGSHNQNQDFTLVPGTDNFYVTTTPQYGSMDAWQIANNVAWSGSNSIYNYHNGDGNDITKSTIYFDYVVDGDITMVPSSKKNTDNGCDFWYVNQTDGMLTHTATITTPSHGTISLAYTSKSGSPSTSTVSGLPHRSYITATAIPATGYEIGTLTVTPDGGSATPITSGAANNHILAKDATFAATFTAKEYTVTLDRNGATSGSESVTMTYNSATHTAITAPSKNGYTFDGWYDSETDNNGSGNLVMNASGVLQTNVSGYTGAGGIWTRDDNSTTLYAKWTPTPYTITYNLDGGDVATPNPTSYTIESAAITLNNPTKTGCDFAGWTGTDLGGATTTVTIAAGSTGDRSYTATWTTKHYTVTWLSNGANYVTPVDYAHGASLALPAGKPSVPGGCSSKVFVGWAETNEITVATSTAPTFLDAGSLGTVTADKTYRAVFADEDDDEVTYSIDWETEPSTTDWDITNFSRSNSYSAHAHGGSYVGVVTTTSGTIKLKHKITPTEVKCYYTKATTNTNNSSSFSMSYSTDGSSWLYLGAGRTMNSVTQWTWYDDLNWTGDDKEDVYVRFEYNGSATTRLIDDISVTCGGVTYDNYITLCETCTDPSDLAASNVTSSGAKITWDGVSLLPTGGFKVVWSTSSSRPGTLTESNSADVAAGTNEYSITGLTKATKYYVWVQSKCNEHWAGSINFTTLDYHTATFIGADGSTLQSGNVDVGAAITYSGSTPVTCDDGDDPSNYFVGWATNTWSGKVAKASIVPTFYDIANGDYLPNMGGSDATFYAVFAKRSGTEPTDHVWTYTFTTNKYGSSGTVLNSGVTQTLDGTDNAVASNKAWTLQALGPWDDGESEFANVATDSKDNDKGIKIGKNAEPAQYMYFNSSAFTGTVTAVKVSTSGGSMTQTTLGLTVDGTSFRNNGNETVYITNANTEYSFTGSKDISGDEIAITWYQASTSTALYIKKIEVDYSTGGDISYSNYMTSCATCVTPSSVAASDITESGATVTWSGTSASGTEGFKVAWNTTNSVPSPLTGSNSADVAKNVKTYGITGLNAGTTYYVFVQSKCNGEWSSYANFTTLAVHTISFAADNGSISGGSISSGSGTSSASAAIINGQTLTFPTVSSTSCGTFEGWVVGTYDSETTPATLYKAGDEMANITAAASYNAVYRVASGAPRTVNDVITYADLAATSAVYAEFDDVTKSSSAVYKGETAKNGTNDIQLRSNNSTSGIVSKISGGLVKKVTFVWGTGNNSGRTVDIYGKNSAYTAASDLYGDAAAKGTSLGSIVEGTSTEVTVSGDYEYVGIRSNSGAAYIASITIQWYGSPMKYMTSPECGPKVELTTSFSQFTYVYNAGPSASQSFTVGGMNLGSNALVVTAPTNYEVCKTSNGTYAGSVSYTPTDGTVNTETVYIRLSAGLSVGDYDYAQASGLSVTSGSATARKAALTGSVTKAAGAIAFTDFNAVDHYEAEMAAGASSVDVTLTVSVTGDGAVSYSRSPAAGSSAVPTTTPTTTLHVTTVGTWTVTANLAAGTNYTNASTNCQVVVYYADRFYDNLHGNDVIVKRNDTGEDHYTIPSLSDETRETSGSCSETHYHFMGWVPESALSSLTDDAAYDAVMITGGTQAASGTNYYAVWAEE